jgi:hypothetical protein
LAHSKEVIDDPLFKKIKSNFLPYEDDLVELKKREKEKKRTQRRESLSKALADSFAQVFKNMFGVGDDDLTFAIKGDGDLILNIVLMNEKGETIEANSRSISQDEKTCILRYGVKYKRMLPFRGKIRVYIDNGKNVKKVPIKYQVALP